MSGWTAPRRGSGRGRSRAGTAGIPDVPKPAWFQLATWTDTSHERVWRAEEMELVTRRISQILGGAVDTTVTEWVTSHGDLHWGNITAPGLSLLDWAD
jgi:hypothetical protein